jgi:diguanylate cyclase (GGDEF)-like protein/PAS domain S-box-containing protein
MAGPREISIGQDQPEFRAIVEALQGFSTILTISDGNNRVLRANAAAIAFIGRAEQDVIGHSVVEFLTEASRKEVMAMTVPGADDGPYGEHELEFERADRTIAWGRVRTIRLKNADGHTTLRISVVEDVTAEYLGAARETVLEADLRAAEVEHRAEEVLATARRLQAEELALFVARHDPLTGLLGRTALIEHLNERAASGRAARALMIIDLDDFNAINDSLGHLVGDAALLEVASRVSDAFPGLLVARYGGDQFAVAAPFVVGESEALAAVELVRSVLEPDVVVGGHSLHITVTIGLALQEVRGSSSTLIRNADSALAHAKRAGHGQFRLYDDAMRSATQDRLLMQDGLRVASAAGQLRVAYQPIVTMADRRIVGAEALLRWTHPERGPISPVEFIPIAEQGGLIVPIGQWVMDTACRDMLHMHRDLGLYISVNASTRQLVGGDFVEWVEAALERASLPPSALTIEVTEGALVDETGPIRTAFEALRARGVRVAIDDFGTGFSSLARLQRLPVDVIKLDRAFVTDIDTRPEGRGLAAAVLQLGTAIGATVIAEGIETEAEATTLLELGYTTAQGFLFARPMAIEHLRQRVARGTVRSAA